MSSSLLPFLLPFFLLFLSSHALQPLEHMDPTLPAILPGEKPKCSVVVLQQDFADTIGSPPATANFTQPFDCPFPWTHVVLELSVKASDHQAHRVAAVWIEGVEVLRTITPVPRAPGAFWKVEKDITRYSAVLRQLAQAGPSGTGGGGGGGGIVSMMMENSNNALPGVYSATVTLHFYRGINKGGQIGNGNTAVTAHPTVKALYREPADLIIPVVSENNADYGSGFWFKIENSSQALSRVEIPTNSYRAVLEVFVSYHGNDENWYINPLRKSQHNNPTYLNLTTPRANGGFRQVYATIDGKYIGGHVPFMVIYPKTFNPFFWTPVSSMGSFDMPSYHIDATPFLSLLLDGQPHQIGLGVRDALSYWLVSANLHVWVDKWSDSIQSALVHYFAPPIKFNRNAEWRETGGQSEISAEEMLRFEGWVSYSRGNFTTVVRQKLKYKSQVQVNNIGSQVTQYDVTNKARAQIITMRAHQLISRVESLLEAPMQVQTSTMNSIGGAMFQKTRLFHQLEEIVNLAENQGSTTSELMGRREGEGSALIVGKGEPPLWLNGTTRSQYKYKDMNTCYLRQVQTAGGVVMLDNNTPSCGSVVDA